MANPPPPLIDLHSKIQSLHARILKERKIQEGFTAMKHATTNQDVISSCESKIRESTKTIGWFEESLRDLEGRLRGDFNNTPGGTSSGGNSIGGGITGGGRDGRGSLGDEDPRMRSLPPPPPGGPDNGSNNYNSPPAGSGSEVAKVTYTSLDLIKADTPLTSAKISRMLHQLEFKLHVEKQYKEGIDKMAKLYLVDGDKKARAETENKRIESNQKMILLSQALRRYKTLDVMGDLGDEDDVGEDEKSLLRKPLSGTLQITIKAARDLAHAPQPKKSKQSSETVIYVKVEDTSRARTHPSRTDRWNEEFEIYVEKANEVEVTIYDKTSTSSGSGEGGPVPIGMMWLRLSDIVEELRRRKMGAEAGPGWVTAARVNSHQGSGGGGSGGAGGALQGGMGGGGVQGSSMMRDNTRGGSREDSEFGGTASEGIDAWFAVEPEGSIALHLNFVKSNVRKRLYDAGGLGRQGAVRKRKEEIHEQNGHKFVQKQFYAVVLCALCSEFLLKGAGMQCEDCKYACHKNCYPKVVTKCISKSNADSDKDEDQINHRIPHRFEPITNISPNWCCHCGLVLPLGRKNARKCTECGITAHTDCVHLVPYFCGMSMEMANKLIADIKSINSNRRPPPSSANRLNLKPTQSRIAPSDRIQTEQDYAGRKTPQTAYDSRLSDTTTNMASEVGRLNLIGSDNQQQRFSPPSSSTSALPSQQQDSNYRPPPPAPLPPNRSGPIVAPLRPQPPSLTTYGDAGSSSMDNRSPSQQQQQQNYNRTDGGGRSSIDQGQAPFAKQPSPQQQQSQSLYSPSQPSQNQNSQLYNSNDQNYPSPPPRQHSQQQQQQQQQQRPPITLQTSGIQPGQIFTPQAQQQQQQQLSPQKQQQQQQLSPDPRSIQLNQQRNDQNYLSQGGAQAANSGALAAVAGGIRRPQPSNRQRRIGLDDFNFLAVLGKGNFGKVMLAEEKKTSQLYAIKVLKKEFIIENDEVESTKSEKRVFLAAARERHPFLLGLHSCFQTETRIYFVMEYVSGGDLMLHIQREQFTPRRAKFYAAEVLLALEYFHKEGIVYRDLKLDNILLTLDGHVKVADYGLCKEDMWFGKTTSTFCGTPEFMAPEIILEQRYGRAVDWWAFGVLIYEMLLGQSPFRGDDEDEIFDAILEDEPLYPIHMPKDSVSILQKLLTRDPARRLGSGEADADEIKSHLFFKDTNWDDIFHKRVPSPFFPSIASATDTSNFDSEFTSEQPTLTPVHSTLSAQDQGEFAGFSWIAPWAAEI